MIIFGDWIYWDGFYLWSYKWEVVKIKFDLVLVVFGEICFGELKRDLSDLCME